MNIQIFGSSKSFDTKKAERWFKERRIKYQYIDILSKGLSPRPAGSSPHPKAWLLFYIFKYCTERGLADI